MDGNDPSTTNQSVRLQVRGVAQTLAIQKEPGDGTSRLPVASLSQ